MTAREPELRAVREAWLEVSDELLAGIGHALSNRVAALTGVAQVLAASTEGPLAGALAMESSRMQRAVQLLRLLVRHWDEEPEPVRLEDVLEDVAELLSHHPELRVTSIRVEADPGLAPVWGERSSLTHAFCMVLSAAGEAAERAGQEAAPVRCSSTAEEVRVEVGFPAGVPSDESNQPPGVAVDPRTARGLIERAGGELTAQEEDGVLTALLIRLPTLTEVRRRERAAAPEGPGGP